MIHRVETVAKYNGLDKEKFVAFAKTSKNAWEEHGFIITSTLFVEQLLKEFKIYEEEHE